jgi:hypothetical protein
MNSHPLFGPPSLDSDSDRSNSQPKSSFNTNTLDMSSFKAMDSHPLFGPPTLELDSDRSNSLPNPSFSTNTLDMSSFKTMHSDPWFDPLSSGFGSALSTSQPRTSFNTNTSDFTPSNIAPSFDYYYPYDSPHCIERKPTIGRYLKGPQKASSDDPGQPIAKAINNGHDQGLSDWYDVSEVGILGSERPEGRRELAGEVTRHGYRAAAAPPPPRTFKIIEQSKDSSHSQTASSKRSMPTCATTPGLPHTLTQAEEIFCCMESGCSVAYTGSFAEQAMCDHVKERHLRYGTWRFRIRRRGPSGWTTGEVIYKRKD